MKKKDQYISKSHLVINDECRGEMMLKHSKKAKWIVGLSGVAFSSFILGQLDTNNEEENTFDMKQSTDQVISEEEDALLALDWDNFVFEESGYVPKEGGSERKTKRS